MPPALGGSRAGPSIHKRTIVILGFRGVGKSAVTGRFVDDTFNEAYNPTIEAHFTTRLKTSKGQDTIVEVYDLAGMDETNEIRQQLILSAHGYMLMYAIKYKHSLQVIRQINDKLLVQCGDDRVPRVLVANMIDLKDGNDSREVTKEEGLNMANELGLEYFETSAKTGEGIKKAFLHLLDEMDKKLHMPTELPQEEIECKYNLCEVGDCCCIIDDNPKPSDSTLNAAIAVEMLLGVTFIALVFLAPHCDTDAQRIWQNYYLLCIGIVKMFVCVLMLVAIQKEKISMQSTILGCIAFVGLANVILGACSILTLSDSSDCKDRLCALGWTMIGSSLPQVFSLTIMYRSHRHCHEVTPQASMTTGGGADNGSFFRASTGWFSSSVIGDNSSLLEHRPAQANNTSHSFSYPKRNHTSSFGASGHLPPSERFETYSKPLNNNV